MRPALGAYSPAIRRATVDLPLPDSPTRPSVSPRWISKLTASTARKLRRGSPSRTRLSQGRDTSKSRLTASSFSRTKSGSPRLAQPAGGAARPGRHQLGARHHATLEALRAARVEGATRRNGVEA